MTTPGTESHSAIEEQAADWLARRDSGAWSVEDQLRFERWLNESPANRVAFLRLEHVWERSGRLRALGAGRQVGEDIPPPMQWGGVQLPRATDANAQEVAFPRSVARGRGRARAALAAAVLLTIASSAALYLRSGGPSYQTPVGGVAFVPMTDGSKVTLNTDSEIRVAVTRTARTVELEQGEAFFEVAKDPARPFVVQAGNKRVIALGTKFAVRRDGDELRVVVTEGRVRVETQHEAQGGAPAEVLTAGSVARASDHGVLLQKKALPEAEEELSWRSGVLILREMTLDDAAAEFNRYNTTKIVIEDPQVGALRVAGSFRATNVDAFVRLLERGYPLRAARTDERIVLSAE
jgi:transmembrane sensor